MSSLLINEPPLQVLPSLAVAIGLNEAIVLQQLHYWTQRVRPAEDGEVWVYNTIEQWQQQFPFWSQDTIARTLKSLRDRGVVVAERRGKNSFDKTLHYRINRQVLDSLDTRNLRLSKPQYADRYPQVAGIGSSNLPESGVADCGSLTTETTQETTQRVPPQPPEGDAGGFEQFWSAYPKHVNQAKARKAFDKVNPDAELLARMLAAIAAWSQSEQWKGRTRFVPAPANWLADRRWEDELPAAAAAEPGVAGQEDWTESRRGIEAMGEQLGLGRWDEEAFNRGGEQWPAYRARVMRAADEAGVVRSRGC